MDDLEPLPGQRDGIRVVDIGGGLDLVGRRGRRLGNEAHAAQTHLGNTHRIQIGKRFQPVTEILEVIA